MNTVVGCNVQKCVPINTIKTYDLMYVITINNYCMMYDITYALMTML